MSTSNVQIIVYNNTFLTFIDQRNMDYDYLSENGIEKVLNNAPSIVQIVDFQVKQKGDTNFFIVQLSDGFARLKKCVIMAHTQKKVKNFDIIRTQIVTPNMKDGKPMHVLIDQYSLVRSDIDIMIGEPINYSDWEKTKKNPKGDNFIPQQKKMTGNGKGIKGPVKQNVNVANFFDDEEEQNQKNKIEKNKSNQGLSRKVSEISSTQSISHATKPNVQQKNVQNMRNIVADSRPSNQNKQASNQAKPQNIRNPPQGKEPRHERTHTLIKELYEGMQEWKLKMRVIFMSEVKTYIKKANGQQSQLFAFQACDQFDSIQLTIFGDSAVNFSQIIELDNIYEISGGKVVKDDRSNKLKIILTQKAVINLLEDDITIPMVDEFCITPEKLLQKDVGSDCNVVALVKDNNQIIEFISKNGKNCKKKEIYLCDPEAQIEVPLTLWFEKADINFEKIPYALQGITVSSFNDQKQFQASMKFNFRQFKQHQFRKFITTLDKMKLDNPVHDFSGKNKPNYEMVNFNVFRTEAQKLQNNNTLTIEKVCYLTQISLSSRNFYMSCPNCRKKVIDEQNGLCPSDKCGKAYQKAKYRYLLNVSLSDQVETIWATAYDEAAEVMLTSDEDGSILIADDFVKIDEEDLKLRIPAYLDRQMKVSITAKKQIYNGQQRVRYSVNKASLDIDYVNQSSILAKQIEFLSCKMKGN